MLILFKLNLEGGKKNLIFKVYKKYVQNEEIYFRIFLKNDYL